MSNYLGAALLALLGLLGITNQLATVQIRDYKEALEMVEAENDKYREDARLRENVVLQCQADLEDARYLLQTLAFSQ